MKVHRVSTNKHHFAREIDCPACQQAAGAQCMTLRNGLMPINEVHIVRVRSLNSGVPVRG